MTPKDQAYCIIVFCAALNHSDQSTYPLLHSPLYELLSSWLADASCGQNNHYPLPANTRNTSCTADAVSCHFRLGMGSACTSNARANCQTEPEACTLASLKSGGDGNNCIHISGGFGPAMAEKKLCTSFVVMGASVSRFL